MYLWGVVNKQVHEMLHAIAYVVSECVCVCVEDREQSIKYFIPEEPTRHTERRTNAAVTVIEGLDEAITDLRH